MKYIFENISVCYYFLDIFSTNIERERESKRILECNQKRK